MSFTSQLFIIFPFLFFVHVYSNMCSQRAGLIPEFAISPVRFHTSVYDCKKGSRSLWGCENIIITLFLLNIWNRRSRVMTYVVIFHCLRSNVVIDVLLCCISNRMRWGSWVLTCQNQFKPSLHFPSLYSVVTVYHLPVGLTLANFKLTAQVLSRMFASKTVVLDKSHLYISFSRKYKNTKITLYARRSCLTSVLSHCHDDTH
jgi:hypothetical protein